MYKQKSGYQELTNEEQILIGAVGTMAGAKVTADTFGLTRRRVDQLVHGKNGEQKVRNDIVEEGIKSTLGIVSDRALEIILASMNHLTDDALATQKPKDLAGIAKDMAVIHEKTQPKQVSNTVNGPQFIVYAPRTKSEEEYDIIEVTPEPE